MLMAENLLLMRRRYRTSVSAAALFLAAYGPLGMVLDFADASVAIVSSGGSLDYQSQGQVSNGALVGPGAKLTYTAPSLKLTEQADGNLWFQAHNLYLNSAAPANQSVTTGMLTGATYAITLTGSVSITLSGAATGTITAGTTTFTAASGTLTCGSTSGSGTVHLRRTPSVDTYIATAGAQVYDLPYVHSSGVRTGIMVEPAATNLQTQSNNPGAWANRVNIVVTDEGTAPIGTSRKVLCNSTSANFYQTNSTPAATSVTCWAVVKQGSGATEANEFRIRDDTAGVNTAQFTINYSTGVLTLASGAATLSSEDMGDGWWKVVAVVAWTSGNSLRFNIGFQANAVVANEYFYYCHSQIETGTVATSPVITYGSPVLRAGDPPEIATSLFPYNVSEGTLYIEAVLASGATVGRLLSLNSNSATIRVADIFITSATAQAYYKTSDSAQVTYTSIAATGLQRVALRYKLNDFNVSYNGTLGGADTATGAIETATMLEIGHLANANQAPMLIKRVAYFPDGKADSALQAIGA